jgi:hypothetical protein
MQNDWWITDFMHQQSFPVAGTLMIEPTESENLEELDRLWRYDFYQKRNWNCNIDNWIIFWKMHLIL